MDSVQNCDSYINILKSLQVLFKITLFSITSNFVIEANEDVTN
jgi:hypothetical protein